jgi:lipopolysaccharide/colanic/teichoic acid biosynthesis glycosyltransferase
MLTRILDILVASFGFMILMLMLPVIGLLIKFDSRGPVFFMCDRVGKDGKPFKMYKFRTMYETNTVLGASVSPQGDPRVTTMGRFLRRSKLNEFPQFINVLKGDMTLVGPRPECLDLAAAYPPEAQPVFSVKPGLVGPNQIVGRNEEELYPEGVDPSKFYIQSILPAKLPLDLEYIRNKSFLLNLKYIFLAVMVTITGAIGRRHLLDNLSQISMILADSACCFLTFFAAYYFRFQKFLTFGPDHDLPLLLLLIWLTRIPLLVYFGCYQTVIRYIDLSDLRKVFLGVSLGSFCLVTIAWLFGLNLSNYGRAVLLLDWLSLTTLLIGYRTITKSILHYLDNRMSAIKTAPRRVLIWGAGEEGRWCLRYLKQNPAPYTAVGFIDENPKMRSRRIDGLKVLGNFHHLDILVQLHEIQEIVVAGLTVTASQMDHLMELQKQNSMILTRFVPRTIHHITPERVPMTLASVN